MEAGEREERASEADRAEVEEAEGGEEATVVVGETTAVTVWSTDVGENEKDEAVAGGPAMTVAVTGAAGAVIC